MMTWFDKVKTCVGWNGADYAQIAEVRRWLNSDLTEVVAGLGEQLAQFKGTQMLMVNTRFVRRFYDVLNEWLVGLLNGTFDEKYVKKRCTFGSKLAEIDWTFEDVILLEGLTRGYLFELARGQLEKSPHALSATMHTLDKALNLDMTLIYSGYLQARDAEMERALLDHFLDVTGFSRTLYENLAGARERSEEDQQQRLF